MYSNNNIQYTIIIVAAGAGLDLAAEYSSNDKQQ